MWQDWLNGILGIWVVIVPFVGFDPTTSMWVLVVSGAVIAILGFWAAAGAPAGS